MVSATHVYKTCAKHTLPFSCQFSLFSLIELRRDAYEYLEVNTRHRA